MTYEASTMAYRDIKNSIDTAKREGKAEDMIRRSLEIAGRCWRMAWMLPR